MKITFLRAFTICISLIAGDRLASAQTRYETVKEMYSKSQRRAVYSDFEKMQTAGKISHCANFYESEPDTVAQSSIIYLSREKKEAGPLFPPQAAKKVIVLSSWPQIDGLFDKISMTTNETELISTTVDPTLGGSPAESRFRVNGP